jgi:hypothetical protein
MLLNLPGLGDYLTSVKEVTLPSYIDRAVEVVAKALASARHADR